LMSAADEKPLLHCPSKATKTRSGLAASVFRPVQA
jgi:hypothetical protein